jgi:hypothetical protein
MTPEQNPQGNYPDRENSEDAGVLRKSRVLFICTFYSERSQITNGYVRARYSDLFDVASAGSEPRSCIRLQVP